MKDSKKTIRKTEIVTKSTRFSEIKVLLRITPHADGSIRISGHLYSEKTGETLTNDLVRTARNEKEMHVKEDQLLNALIKQQLPLFKASTVRKTSRFTIDANGIFNKAFQALEEEVKTQDVDGNLKSNVFTTWNGDTCDRYLTYFKRNLLPMLCDLEDTGNDLSSFEDEELETIKKRLESQAISSGKSSKKIRLVSQSVEKQLAAAEKIYQRMKGLEPALPDIHFSSEQRVKQFQPEHAKSLPDNIRYALIRLLTNMVSVDPNLTFHILMMFVGGLRDGEACAVTEEQLLINDAYAAVSVISQVKDGNLVPILKTTNAYRIVIFPFWGKEMIRQCIEKLHKEGTQITPIMDVSFFSATIKRILLECGCNASFFRAAQVLMDKLPDKVGDEICTSVEAYILRRDFASRCKNICGLNNDEIDALLGHKREKGSKRSRVNFANPDAQEEVAAKLERFVYDPLVSRNPEFAPLQLAIDQDFKLIPYNKYVLVNNTNQPMIVDLALFAQEPDENINLVITGKSSMMNAKCFSKTFDPYQRDIIGNAYALKDD